MGTPGPAPGRVVDRQHAIQSYQRNRARTEVLFDVLDPDAYYERPIPLRHPVVFYEGHIPAFSVNCFLKKALGHRGLDRDLEVLFARGIDPSDQTVAERSAIAEWPTRSTVQEYSGRADTAILGALDSATIEGDGNAVLQRGQGVFTMLEHEVMHQETLLYMWHRFAVARKRRPGSATRPITNGASPTRSSVRVPSGRTTLGAEIDDVRFGWDNEFPQHVLEVPAFDLDVHDVTNEEYRSFVEAGGYTNPALWTPGAWERLKSGGRRHPLFWERVADEWHWRGMFETVPLPRSWPVFVTHDEAQAYTRWRGDRLPTEAEFHRAAYGAPDGSEYPYPWGGAEPDPTRGNFDFHHWDPVPVGSYPDGVSAWGVHDLVGNGWEWTSTVFEGFPGFAAMASYPEYSADFFDGDHFVVKGASPATGRDLIRRSFRNWFRPSYPYMYATFRCARAA